MNPDCPNCSEPLTEITGGYRCDNCLKNNKWPSLFARSNQVTEFLRDIGRKGGLAGKGSPRKRQAAKQAAENRWRKDHPVPKKILDSNKQLV